MRPDEGICVHQWIGEWGEYTVPADLAEAWLLRKDGWPDHRSPARYELVMDWVAEQEAKSKLDASGAKNG